MICETSQPIGNASTIQLTKIQRTAAGLISPNGPMSTAIAPRMSPSVWWPRARYWCAPKAKKKTSQAAANWRSAFGVGWNRMSDQVIRIGYMVTKMPSRSDVTM